MARERKTSDNITWEYEFPLPLLNLQADFRTQPPGTFSRLIGVDGRYSGKLRRFPGFELMETVSLLSGDATGYTFGGSQGITLFEPFIIQESDFSQGVLRGIVFLANDGGSPANDKLFVYVSVNGAAPVVTAVVDFGTTTNRPVALDVAVFDRFLYLVGEKSGVEATGRGSRIEQLIRYTGSSGGWAAVQWPTSVQRTDPANFARPESGFAPTNVTRINAGYLARTSPYGLAFRVVFPDIGFVTPLTQPEVTNYPPDPDDVSSTVDNGYFVCTLEDATRGESPLNLLGYIAQEARLQVFRTLSRSGTVVQNDPERVGRLYLEAEWVIPRQTVGDAAHRATFETSTGVSNWEPGSAALPTLTVGTWPTGIAVDDVAYIEYPLLTNDLANGSNLKNYVWPVWKRRVVAIDEPTKTITLDEAICTKVGQDLGGGVDPQGTIWISKTSGADTGGTFKYSEAAFAIGWRPRSSLTGGVYIRWAADTPTGLPDEALAAQPELTAEEFGVFSPENPLTHFIEDYEGVGVRITVPDSRSTGALNTLRWERTDLPRKGIIPVLNRRFLGDLGDSVSGFVSAPPFLMMAANNGLIRIHRSGDRIAVDPIHNRFGSIGVKSMVSVGSTVYMASESGILLVDLMTGQVDALNATQHLFDEAGTSWRDDLASIQAAYDAPTSSLVFLNPVKFEAILIWLNEGIFTQLIDVPFDDVTTSGDFRTGGLRRAVFFNELAGRVYEIDADRSEPNATTAGDTNVGTLNGFAQANTTSTQLSLGPTGSAVDLVGHFARFHTVGGVEQNPPARSRITGVFGGIDVGYDLQTAVAGLAEGDRFSLAAIPMRVTCFPLSGDPDQPILDLFRVKLVESMGLVAVDNSRALNATHDVVKYQLFERSATTAATQVEKALSVTTNVDNFGKITRAHSLLVPGFELWSSDLDINLLGMVVTGRILGTANDQRT